MKRSTKELALCGVMTALSVVLLCLGGVIPLAIYACPMLASCALLVLREMCRAQYAWCCWASVALLTLLLGPDKEAAALYLFLGYYPLLQPKLDAILRPALRWMAKLALAVVSVGTMYLVLLYVLGLTQVTEEFADTAPWLLWITAALGLVVFIVYDILLRRFAILWRRRRKR